VIFARRSARLKSGGFSAESTFDNCVSISCSSRRNLASFCGRFPLTCNLQPATFNSNPNGTDRTIPKGLNHPAQGCDGRRSSVATLGNRSQKNIPNPNGVESSGQPLSWRYEIQFPERCNSFRVDESSCAVHPGLPGPVRHGPRYPGLAHPRPIFTLKGLNHSVKSSGIAIVEILRKLRANPHGTFPLGKSSLSAGPPRKVLAPRSLSSISPAPYPEGIKSSSPDI